MKERERKKYEEREREKYQDEHQNQMSNKFNANECFFCCWKENKVE